MSQKDYIHPICFAIACEGALKGEIFTVCCLGTWCNIYKQTERKCYLLPVINSMKFVETLSLFQIIICCQLSVVHWVMSDNLFKHQCCLLSSSRSDVMWSSIVLLTPCPWKTGLTSLFTMIDQLTCCWPYDAPWDHLQKIKIESCHSLPVDYETRLLIPKGSVAHKLLSWDNISDLC